jgi:hypothetical protein
LHDAPDAPAGDAAVLGGHTQALGGHHHDLHPGQCFL